jgi:signal transduction histidine kinase
MSYPVNFITAACANLLDELKSDAIDREKLALAIEAIEQNALRCGRIAEALRHYAGPKPDEPGGLAVAITSPQAILEDTLLMVDHQFQQQAHLSVAAEYPEKALTIVCEHHAITQVLVNLLNNARDAMGAQGGTIQVRFWKPDLTHEPELATHIQAALGANGQWPWLADLVAFSVTDLGPGIAPYIEDHLFEPFTTTKRNGLGLGLAVARDIVDRHGGALWGQNNPQGGATFTVVLPRKQYSVNSEQ